MNKEIIKSISFDEQEIIQNILNLHCDTQIELDPTYSKGNFYKGKFEEPLYKFDLYPQIEGVVKANAENLPINDNVPNATITLLSSASISAISNFLCLLIEIKNSIFFPMCKSL